MKKRKAPHTSSLTRGKQRIAADVLNLLDIFLFKWRVIFTSFYLKRDQTATERLFQQGKFYIPNEFFSREMKQKKLNEDERESFR